ncbi:ABC transporter ATP-binding protein [Maridesulfovibrio hydrothermalis]|uniref:Oligopeptide ABC transporter (ATP-binding protein) n=1 Tax=Maridesulfovibrio hydrothermalis AM13 = DSM 14728 TaxID=1121451 RepID=L0RBY4_9BACT|nr:ABC transporter ATP-binding protein [Maridesulfovibrio hydrothermalis]CCO24264.1 oligopeptide ABC transporter (ATP-binding protein) [Maridesulfovibrio hydrothermalis AM13 = DSM 14728]
MTTTILEIKNLTTSFATPTGVIKAVDNASLDLGQGETLAIVGESGCGKTVLSLSVMGLIPDPPGRITSGQVIYQGQDLVQFSKKQLQKIRGNQLSMIFQEPMTSLNPVFKIGDQIGETLRLHKNLDKNDARQAAIDALKLVGIPNPHKRVDNFPHELSGGMRQRVMIAMALACSPEILIADEPTTALDVTIQAQILRLLDEMKHRMNGSLMLITHDLGVVARVASRVAVMYAGQLVECANIIEIFKDPLHPYTKGLLASVPKLGSRAELTPIPGNVPALGNLPRGCRFHPRCKFAFDRCKEQEPIIQNKDDRQIRCWLHS